MQRAAATESCRRRSSCSRTAPRRAGSCSRSTGRLAPARPASAIYTIALGTKNGTLDLGNGLGGNFGFSGQRIAVVPDPAILKAIAEATGGRAYTASSAAAAQRAYRTLGTSLTTRPGKREVSSWFAGAAAALLLGSLGASLLTAGRLP